MARALFGRMNFFLTLLALCGQQQKKVIVQRNVFLYCASDSKHFETLNLFGIVKTYSWYAQHIRSLYNWITLKDLWRLWSRCCRSLHVSSLRVYFFGCWTFFFCVRYNGADWLHMSLSITERTTPVHTEWRENCLFEIIVARIVRNTLEEGG